MNDMVMLVKISFGNFLRLYQTLKTIKNLVKDQESFYSNEFNNKTYLYKDTNSVFKLSTNIDMISQLNLYITKI